MLSFYTRRSKLSGQLPACLLLAANLAIGSSLLLGTGGCADSLSYATNARHEGMGLYNEGAYADAAGAFGNATRQDPRDYHSYYYMASSYEQMHDYQQAISGYKSCLDVMNLTLLGKNDPQFRMRALDSLASAIAHSSSQDFETKALEKKCEGQAKQEDQWLLAKVYRYTGDADAAVDAYNKAVLINPKNFTIAKEAGIYEEGLGQTQRASFALRSAYAVHPNDAEVIAALQRMGVPAIAPDEKDERDIAQAPAFYTPGGASQAASIQTPQN